MQVEDGIEHCHWDLCLNSNEHRHAATTATRTAEASTSRGQTIKGKLFLLKSRVKLAVKRVYVHVD